MSEKIVRESLDEGIFGSRKPRNITDGIDMDVVVDLIDIIEDREKVTRDMAIAVVEKNIDMIRKYFEYRYNVKQIYREMKMEGII